MIQTTIFDAPIARRTDKATSHQAAASIRRKLGDLQALVVEIVSELGEATANEVGRAAMQRGVNGESARKRITECVRLGKLLACEPRICQVTGKLGTTYRVEEVK